MKINEIAHCRSNRQREQTSFHSGSPEQSAGKKDWRGSEVLSSSQSLRSRGKDEAATISELSKNLLLAPFRSAQSARSSRSSAEAQTDQGVATAPPTACCAHISGALLSPRAWFPSQPVCDGLMDTHTHPSRVPTFTGHRVHALFSLCIRAILTC